MKRIVLLLALAACAPREPALPRPSASPRDFMARQHVTAIVGEARAGFDAVVQKRGDELIVLGLTPFGSRAFLVKQTGDRVTFEKYVELEMPFPPEAMLRDVHQALVDRPDDPPAHQTIDRGRYRLEIDTTSYEPLTP